MELYKHGAYGDTLPTQDYVAPVNTGTLPVYVGRAPVHQTVSGGEVNSPILIGSYQEAVAAIGYSEDWEQFELSEVIYAHFKNSIKTIGPIVVINVLDTKKHLGAEKSEQITPVNNACTIDSGLVLLSSISITGKTSGTDYAAAYNSLGNQVTIKFLSDVTSPVTVKYKEVTPDAVKYQDIMKGIEIGLPLIYQRMNKEPNILSCPGWSHMPAVHDAMIGAVQKINGHWDAYVHTDIQAESIQEAITFKQANAYTSPYETPCFPMLTKGNRRFHMSTIRTVAMQQTDYANNGIPFETPSNKPADITGLCTPAGKLLEYDQITANTLNAKGISTVTYWGGRWVIWGSHTGAYEFLKDMDVKDKHDCSIRMLMYLTNAFQQRYGILVDKPMNRARVDTILNDYGEFLDNLKGNGALLFGEIKFNETSNPISDVIEGDFVFDVRTTTTPPGKSLTAKVQYTVDGINILYGGETA